MPYYKTDEVRAAARGRWLDLLDSLAPDLRDAINRAGRHVSCPVHGTDQKRKGDGFRLFKDVDDTGGGVCNTCGCFSDGFALLQWVLNTSFEDVKNQLGAALGLTSYPTKEEIMQMRAQRKAPAGQKRVERSSPTPCVPAESSPAPQLAAEASSASTTEVMSSASWRRDLPEWSPRPQSRRNNAAVAYAAEPEPIIEQPPVAEEPRVVSFPQPSHDEKPAAAQLIRDPQRAEELQKRRERLKQSRDRSNARAETNLEQVWSQTVPLLAAGTDAARNYLKSRGIVIRWNAVLEQDSIHFHPGLPYYALNEDDEPELKGHFPAIVCAIRDLSGNIVTLHRTYLTASGKKLSRYGDARKMMSVPDSRGEVAGAAIQMGQPVDGVLGVAEGLETALSAYRGTRIPCWSAVNATLLEKIQLPNEVEKVLIWADKDKSFTGQTVATRLAERLKSEGRKVHIFIPDQPVPTRAKGIDWNDVLMEQGLLGFPRSIR